VFSYIATQLATPAVTDAIPQQLDKAYAIAVGQAFTAPTTRPVELAADTPRSFPMQLLRYGAILTPALQSAYVVAAQDLRAQLINAVSCSGGTTTDCTLFDDLRMLSLPPPPMDAQDADLGTATDLMHYGSKLGGLVKRFFADCICRALNPPCPPCDDPGVLLACIKVRDCHVIEVCNMARTFVWSPAAMRYWLPPLTWLGDLIAKLCCTGPCGDDGQRAGFHSDPQAQFVMEMITRPSPESLALALPAFYGSGAYLPTITSAGRELVDLATRRILPGNLGTTTAPAPDFAAIERRLQRVEQQLAARKQS